MPFNRLTMSIFFSSLSFSSFFFSRAHVISPAGPPFANPRHGFGVGAWTPVASRISVVSESFLCVSSRTTPRPHYLSPPFLPPTILVRKELPSGLHSRNKLLEDKLFFSLTFPFFPVGLVARDILDLFSSFCFVSLNTFSSFCSFRYIITLNSSSPLRT